MNDEVCPVCGDAPEWCDTYRTALGVSAMTGLTLQELEDLGGFA